MNGLPSLWQLLLPNFNGFTFLGIIAIVIGIIIIRYKKIIKKFYPKVNTQNISLLLMLIGIILIWFFSILEDLIRSQYGGLIIGGIIVSAFVWYILFATNNKKNK